MSTTTLPSVAVRVVKGAQLLDRCRPGWATEVNPDRLDLRLEEDDVLGQLYGTYHLGLDELTVCEPAAARCPGGLAVWHGFQVHDADPPAVYAQLTAWRAAVARRRGDGAR